ncbi:MAG: hypothetical protein KIS81_08280 [Maricaulaceae bacterium]|nr:hypothetical protein [Maricaulaceae bacterium]
MRAGCVGLVAAMVLASGAAAQAPQAQGSFNDWRVFTRDADGDRICYAVSEPTDSSPRNVDHGEVFFMIASWRSGAAREQPSFLAGYALRPDSPPRARVGSDRFNMFVAGREGFIEDLGQEAALVRAMRRGSTMRIEATSARGTATAYEFSLRGVTAALEQAERLCAR